MEEYCIHGAAVGTCPVTGCTIPAPKIYITTYLGHRIDPFNPQPENFSIVDIAHALSNICRWNGQIREFFSVAQHCIYVSYLCNPEDAALGLLHDSPEAYLGDLINPVKHNGSMKEYIKLETKFGNTIAKAFGLPNLDKTESVEIADLLMLGKEAKELGRPIPSKCEEYMNKWKGVLDIMNFEILSPQEARKRYIKRFQELIYGKKE